MRRWCFDIDGTICEEKPKGTHFSEYAYVKPIPEMVDLIRRLYQKGDYIILATARHMGSTESNLGLVNAKVGKITYDWLDKHNIPYDEIYFSKPLADFYVDDKAVLIKDVNLYE